MNMMLIASIPSLVIAFYWLFKLPREWRVRMYTHAWVIVFFGMPLLIAGALGAVMEGVTGPYSAFIAEIVLSIALWFDKNVLVKRAMLVYNEQRLAKRTK